MIGIKWPYIAVDNSGDMWITDDWILGILERRGTANPPFHVKLTSLILICY